MNNQISPGGWQPYNGLTGSLSRYKRYVSRYWSNPAGPGAAWNGRCQGICLDWLRRAMNNKTAGKPFLCLRKHTTYLPYFRRAAHQKQLAMHNLYDAFSRGSTLAEKTAVNRRVLETTVGGQMYRIFEAALRRAQMHPKWEVAEARLMELFKGSGPLTMEFVVERRLFGLPIGLRDHLRDVDSSLWRKWVNTTDGTRFEQLVAQYKQLGGLQPLHDTQNRDAAERMSEFASMWSQETAKVKRGQVVPRKKNFSGVEATAVDASYEKGMSGLWIWDNHLRKLVLEPLISNRASGGGAIFGVYNETIGDGHALAVYLPEKSSRIYFLDPNEGEFCFPYLHDFKSFFCAYYDRRYKDDPECVYDTVDSTIYRPPTKVSERTVPGPLGQYVPTKI